jgi:hypothetical protein
MRIVLSVLALVFAVVGSAPASARSHHKHHAHHRQHSHRHNHHRVHHHLHRKVVQQQPRSFLGSFPSVSQPTQRVTRAISPVIESGARPHECYSVGPWCGCWLRHYLGIADRAYNLARNWAGLGQRTSAHSGAIVVWRHHVGVLRSEPDSRGRALVLSGNDGHRVRERVRSLRGAIAFREL